MLKLFLVRKQRGLTQVELSELSGISQPRISAIERGECVVWKGWKTRIAHALKWQGELSELFEEIELSELFGDVEGVEDGD